MCSIDIAPFVVTFVYFDWTESIDPFVVRCQPIKQWQQPVVAYLSSALISHQNQNNNCQLSLSSLGLYTLFNGIRSKLFCWFNKQILLLSHFSCSSHLPMLDNIIYAYNYNFIRISCIIWIWKSLSVCANIFHYIQDWNRTHIIIGKRLNRN